MEQEQADLKELLAQKLKQEGKDSVHNSSEEEDDSVRELREQKEELENQKLINYNYLGSEECPCPEDADEIEYSMVFRIPRIENLEKCVNLKVSYSDRNLIANNAHILETGTQEEFDKED